MLPASCRHNGTIRARTICRQDPGSTLRVTSKLNTGGDHDAHTILRGFDGWFHLMAGYGAGLEDRKHITEDTSPVLFEREASVFRVSPDGAKWECVAAGGRNPPNLGNEEMNNAWHSPQRGPTPIPGGTSSDRGQRASVLDCGGKQSATPLWILQTWRA